MQNFINKLFEISIIHINSMIEGGLGYLLILLAGLLSYSFISIALYKKCDRLRNHNIRVRLLKLGVSIIYYIVVSVCVGILYIVKGSNLSTSILIQAGILYGTIYLVVKFLDNFILTAALIIAHILRHISWKNHIKQVKRKESTKRTNTHITPEIEHISKEFTRVWITKQIKENPSISRYELLVKNKKVYINELQEVLPNSCNKAKTALYYYTHFCAIWK